jgi:D-alanine-D-alanine ligase
MTRPRVLILFNEPTLPADHPDADSEYDILDTADTVAGILNESNVAVERLGLRDDPTALLERVKSNRPDVVFNLYEGLARWGNTEAFVAGLLEMLRVPFTGSPTQPLMLCRSKPLTKSLLAGAGLPTAPFFVVDDGAAVPRCRIEWPVIVKPGREDASVGIDQSSVVTSQLQLEDRVEYVRARYGPSVLVERFVRGREFNVAVLERGGKPATLPYSEIFFEPPAGNPGLWPIVSFDAKWKPGTLDFKATPVRNPADVCDELRAKVDRLSLKAFELVGCSDYARVDFRVDEDGEPFILEVNPNPCISPLAGLAAALESAKIPYGDFVAGLVGRALRRGPAPELAGRVKYAPAPPATPESAPTP